MLYDLRVYIDDQSKNHDRPIFENRLVLPPGLRLANVPNTNSDGKLITITLKN